MANKKPLDNKKESPPNNEEQMQKRQSAPTPSAFDFLKKQQDQMLANQGIASNGAVYGTNAISNPIGREQVNSANLLLLKYKKGKANLENKIVENEKWYKLRHWECLRSKEDNVEPASGWLFNSIANKHADAMDNFPSPNILPREEGDKAEAKKLSSILPVVLDQCDFEQVYSDVWMYKIKTGTGVYGIFWDKSKLNGLGDIAIKKVDLLNLFWESGVTDIQKSRNLFHVELMDNDLLLQAYPQLQGKLGGGGFELTKYTYDDDIDTTEKSLVVDWYYKKTNSTGKQVLHYCKYVNDVVLFATENDENFRERGWYDHAEYPFVFDTLYPIEGTPVGFGYIDIGKLAQEYIDRGGQAIMKNMLANTKPRHFIRSDGSVNETEYADMDKDFVHVNGNLGQDSIMPIQGKPLSDIYVTVLTNKIDELKETTGNRDISTGGTTSGVTAASAIAAMQEAGSKLSRDNIKASYRAFRKICLMCVELIRQFYDLPRMFRILGEQGAYEFVQYSNENIVPQAQGNDFGVEMGMRLPLFDIEITAQKQSPYSKMAQNELALQFYQAGFFNPAMADQALLCLDMMDFDRKDFIIQKITQNLINYQLQQQALAMQGAMVYNSQPIDTDTEDNAALGGSSSGDSGESSTTRKARQRVADSTNPT